jgi:hypothetical protein
VPSTGERIGERGLVGLKAVLNEVYFGGEAGSGHAATGERTGDSGGCSGCGAIRDAIWSRNIGCSSSGKLIDLSC